MIKINTDSTAFDFARTTAGVGICMSTGWTVGTLVEPFLPKEITLGMKIGLNLINYAVGLVASQAIISEAERIIGDYNEVVDAHNEKRN